VIFGVYTPLTGVLLLGYFYASWALWLVSGLLWRAGGSFLAACSLFARPGTSPKRFGAYELCAAEYVL
jgi:hypothetical protein